MKLLWITPAVIALGMFTLALLSQRGKAKGLVDGRLAPLPNKPNCVSSESGTDDDKRIEPLSADKDTVKAAIISTGGVITAETNDYISATYTSKLMRFVDDVEFRRAAELGGEHWHIRSASRVGHSDMGANRKRVERIRRALQSHS